MKHVRISNNRNRIIVMLQWNAEQELQTNEKVKATAASQYIDSKCFRTLLLSSTLSTQEQRCILNWFDLWTMRNEIHKAPQNKCWWIWWWSKVFQIFFSSLRLLSIERERRNYRLPQLMPIKHFVCFHRTFFTSNVFILASVMFALRWVMTLRDLYCVHCIIFVEYWKKIE